MSGKGSGGNVLAALCSFFIPGLGQLLQGRLFAAIFCFIFAFVAWFFLLGWIIHLISVLDAAIYSPKNKDNQDTIEQTKKCPYCAEIIKSEAVICRFCGKELPVQSIETINQQNNRTRLSNRQCYLCHKKFSEEDLKEIGGEVFCSVCEVKINPALLKTIES